MLLLLCRVSYHCAALTIVDRSRSTYRERIYDNVYDLLKLRAGANDARFFLGSCGRDVDSRRRARSNAVPVFTDSSDSGCQSPVDHRGSPGMAGSSLAKVIYTCAAVVRAASGCQLARSSSDPAPMLIDQTATESVFTPHPGTDENRRVFAPTKNSADRAVSVNKIELGIKEGIRHRNFLSTAAGGGQASGPESTPSARPPRPLPHETIVDPLCRGRRKPDMIPPDGSVRELLAVRLSLARQRVTSRLENDQAMAGSGSYISGN